MQSYEQVKDSAKNECYPGKTDPISSLWNWYKVEQSLPTGGFFGSLTIHKQDREKINITGWNGGESEYKEGRDGTKPIHTACKDHISPQWCLKNNIWSGHFFIFIFNNFSQFLCRWFDFSKANIFFWNYYPLRFGRRPKIWGVFNLELLSKV